MDFSIPQDYLEYKNQVIAFAQAELDTTDLIERDKKGEFSQVLWDKCGRFGLVGLSVPKKYGGTFEKVDILKSVFALQGLGYGCPDVGLGLALNAHLWAVQMTINQFGSDAQKEKYLPKMSSGSWIGAHALTEEGSGSDVFNMSSTADKVEGGYVLNGVKRLVTLAPIAEVAVAFAMTDPTKGKWGISAFIVDRSMKGFEPQPTQEKMGLRTVPIGRIQFNDCFVPEENRLGPEGAGLSISNHSLEYDRCGILSAKLGTMERQIETSVAYANSRVVGGQPIAKHQAVAHRIAEMKLRFETAQLLLYKMAWLKQNDKPAMLEGALLKLHLSEAFVASSLDYIRIHGGNGYLTEHGVERDLRDSIGGVLYAGTSDIQKNIIAKYLGL